MLSKTFQREENDVTLAHRVLLTDDLLHSASGSWTSLSQYARLIKSSAKTRTEFFHECQSGVLDGVLVVYRTFESVELTGRFDEQLVKSLPSSVRFICHNGTEASFLQNFLVRSLPLTHSISKD